MQGQDGLYESRGARRGLGVADLAFYRSQGAPKAHRLGLVIGAGAFFQRRDNSGSEIMGSEIMGSEIMGSEIMGSVIMGSVIMGVATQEAVI